MPRQGMTVMTTKNGRGRGKEYEKQRRFPDCLIYISWESKISCKAHKPRSRSISIFNSTTLNAKKGNMIN